MKNKIFTLLVIGQILLITGCGNNKTGNGINYTNKYECYKIETYTKYDVENKSYGFLLHNDTVESENVLEKKTTKIYDFNKKGDKLIGYYIVEMYTYKEKYDMQKEKEEYQTKCNKNNGEKYENCEVKLDDDVITLTLTMNMENKENIEETKNITLESIKSEFSKSDEYTCK